MPLLFVPPPDAPSSGAFFLWGEPRPPPELPAGVSARQAVVAPGKRGPVDGQALPLLDTLASLAAVPSAQVPALPASVACWCLASKLALSLAARERVVPLLERDGDATTARWAVALSDPTDRAALRGIASAMPPSAHAVRAPGGLPREVWAPEALLRAFLDATVDGLIRSQTLTAAPTDPERLPWEVRWSTALRTADRRFVQVGPAERALPAAVDRWTAPARAAADRPRACFRLELPQTGGRGARSSTFTLRFLLQSPDDPSLLVTADEVWRTRGRSLSVLGRALLDPQESLLGGLSRAARLYSPIAEALTEARPESLSMDAAGAFAFLDQGAPALAEAGFGVLVPGELTAAGQRRLRSRMRIGARPADPGAVVGGGLDLAAALSFSWEAALGDDVLSATELAALARHKAPLVRHRGEWVVVDPAALADVRARLSQTGTLTAREALRATLLGEIERDGEAIPVAADGAFAAALERVRGAGATEPVPPVGLQATLRPYQARGLHWLSTLAGLGLGGCLADDMGLGKTLQLLTLLLLRRQKAPDDPRPSLLVAPTSVVGNWVREARRFTPQLPLVRHHGPGRATRAEALQATPGALVITSYGVLRQDKDLLASVEWATVALDEAQNVKNPASATAAAARALPAAHRFALTGTPVENRLAELWSILEFAVPGLLGPRAAFDRGFAVPIERYGDDGAATRLRRLTGPFLLRRRKSDPGILEELPPKAEAEIACTLTREQASLYRAVLDEEMQRIEGATGASRRGQVLALLTYLKQVCNHPAQYLGEAGPLSGRSGKLARLTEMLDEAVSAGDRSLVFTQYREMGDRLVAHLEAALGVEVPFLHGGTSAAARDEQVRRFQLPDGPPVFVLSLKAGGTGLNLTAARHVFHYDRWWNPAVEDQATDRAHRMGQAQAVSVHKLVCVGTVEERVAMLLERKRELAAKVVTSGEQWITALDDGELRDLLALADDDAIVDDDDEGAAKPRRRRVRKPDPPGASARANPVHHAPTPGPSHGEGK
jgi:superfamily II DNA or RNA helicase